MADQQADPRGSIWRRCKSAMAADAKISQLSTERKGDYAAYFDALLEEEEELNGLYEPLSSVLEQFGASVAKLKFSKRAVDVDAWALDGEEFLDLRTSGSFRGKGELARAARAKLNSAWETGDGAVAADAIEAFAAEYSDDFLGQSRVSIHDAEAYTSWERSVSAWLYSASHVTLHYGPVGPAGADGTVAIADRRRASTF
jgi:hypothetical protein